MEGNGLQTDFMNAGDKMDKLIRNSDGHATTLAAAVGVHPNTVYEWIKGNATPRMDVAFKVARHFGVSLDWLADDDAEWEDMEGGGIIPDIDEELIAIVKLMGRDRAKRRLLGLPDVQEKTPTAVESGRITSVRFRGPLKSRVDAERDDAVPDKGGGPGRVK